jgi:transcriptional regulator with XRE-family HTH domain
MSASDDQGGEPPKSGYAAPTRSASAIDQHVGARLRVRRETILIGVADLARFAGVSAAELDLYETGERRIPPGQLTVIAERLGVRTTWFFDEFPG